jgi:transposase-like protein
MGRKFYSQEFKDKILKDLVENSNNTALVAQKHGLSQRTVYNWFEKSQKGVVANEVGQLKKVKRELDDAKLENAILRELLKKTYQVWPQENK